MCACRCHYSPGGICMCSCKTYESKVQDRTYSVRYQQEPKESGWYAYSGGAQYLIFHLDADGQWRVFCNNGMTDKCTWSYIAQALDVWTLVPLLPQVD